MSLPTGLTQQRAQTPLLYKTDLTKIIPENRYFQLIDLDYLSTKFITHTHAHAHKEFKEKSLMK